jgi:hypothetical protein
MAQRRWSARGLDGTPATSSTTGELLGRCHYLKMGRRELGAVARRKGALVAGRHRRSGAPVKGGGGAALEGCAKTTERSWTYPRRKMIDGMSCHWRRERGETGASAVSSPWKERTGRGHLDKRSRRALL